MIAKQFAVVDAIIIFVCRHRREIGTKKVDRSGSAEGCGCGSIA